MSDHDRIRKPWYRPRNPFLAVVLLIGGLVLYAVFIALTARPGNAVDYAKEMNALARRNQPGNIDAPNRWDEYVEMLEAFQTVRDACETAKSSTAGEEFRLAFAFDATDIPEEYAAALRAEAMACLNAIRASGVYERLDSFLEPGPVYREFSSGQFLIGSLYEGFAESRAMSRAVAAEFRVALREGRDADAARAVEHAFTLARISSHQPILIGYLVGLAQSALTLEHIRAAAIDGELDAKTARTILTVLDQVDIPKLSLGIDGEEMGMLDLIQRLHTDNGDGNGMFLLSEFRRLDLGLQTPSGISTHPIVNAAGLIFPDKETTTGHARAFYQQVREQAAMTPITRRGATNLDAEIDRLGPMNMLLKIMLPALGGLSRHGDHITLDYNATRILLALTIYHAEHGAYPDTLEALVPGILAELPSDGFAPDGAFRYTKRTPTPEDPRGFILYSVGGDFTDDGGLFMDNRHAPREGQPSMDYVVNPPPSAAETGSD